MLQCAQHPIAYTSVGWHPVYIGHVPVHPVTLSDTLGFIDDTIRTGRRAVIHYANAHAINLAEHDAEFRAAMLNASLVFCDGKSLQWAARLLGRRLPQRFTPPDWIDDVCGLASERGYRIFFLGGSRGVADAAAQRLQRRHSGVRIDSYYGYFDKTPIGSKAILHRIHESRTDILLVGMGMPLQERWILEHLEHLQVAVVMSVGGLFDFVSGHKPRGPSWMTSIGLEWLARLINEPRRLSKRYLLGNPSFLRIIFRQAFGRRVKSEEMSNR